MTKEEFFAEHQAPAAFRSKSAVNSCHRRRAIEDHQEKMSAKKDNEL